MPTTDDDMKYAFAGESQASQKYLAFAKQAEKEGFKNVARLFRTTSQAEQIHAEGHFKSMGGVGDSVANLQAAIDGETEEFTEMYPPMLQRAEEAGHKASRMFGYAMKAEKVHAELYSRALEAVKQGKDLDAEIYLCPVCGHIEFGKPGEACPICNAKAESYVQV